MRACELSGPTADGAAGTELMEAFIEAGPSAREITVAGRRATSQTVNSRLKMGLALLPEDGNAMGC